MVAVSTVFSVGSPLLGWKLLVAAWATALLLNRTVRVSAFVLGAVLLAESGFDRAIVFCAVLLLVVSFSRWRPVRPLPGIAIWGIVLLQFGVLLFATTPGIFAYAATIAGLGLVNWPDPPLLVIFDGDCGFCVRAKSWVERLDLEGLLVWEPYQDGAGTPYGITDDQASRRLYLISGGTSYSGFRALKMMVLYNPVGYLILYTLLAALHARQPGMRSLIIGTLLVLFSPLFQPLGDALYDLVARNRRSLSANSNCRIP